MSYGRMKEGEARLKAEIASLLMQAESTDVSEDEQYGADSECEALPVELRRRENRLRVIAAAKARLEARQREPDA